MEDSRGWDWATYKGVNMSRVPCSKCVGTGASSYGLICSLCAGIGSFEGTLVEDKVNHPKHYTFGTIEVIDVIEDWQLGFHEGNCIKYIARAKHKGNELEDLKKAEWYLKRKIEDIELEIAARDNT